MMTWKERCENARDEWEYLLEELGGAKKVKQLLLKMLCVDIVGYLMLVSVLKLYQQMTMVSGI